MRCITSLLLCAAPVAHAADWTPRAAAGINGLVAHGAVAPPGGRPLLVALHGCAQPNTALQQAGLAEAAEATGGVVALPAVPNGGVLAGCWDYYGVAHGPDTRHLGPLIGFVEALLADESLDIDPDRVWIAGLSSGAGEALVAGCVAPDLFSGVAAIGGPGLGTEAAQIAQVATNAERVESTCRQLSRAPAAFARQQAVILVGTSDYIVAQGYAPVNAAGFAALYGAAMTRSQDLADLPGGAAGEVEIWQAGGTDRVALLTVTGLDHAWPAGRGAGATMQFVAPGGPDIGRWLFDFFGDAAAPGPAPEPSAPVEPEPAPTAEPAPSPEPEPDCVPAEVERVEATLVGHSARMGVHGGIYGAVDIAYVDLLARYGTSTPFALYRGPDGWYHDPENLPPSADCEPAPSEPEPVAQPEPGVTPEPATAPEPGVIPEPAAEPAAEPAPRGDNQPKVIDTGDGCALVAPRPGGRRPWTLGWLLLGWMMRRRLTRRRAERRG